jgi:hypothetical protein
MISGTTRRTLHDKWASFKHHFILLRDPAFQSVLLFLCAGFALCMIYLYFWFAPNAELDLEEGTLSRKEVYELRSDIRRTFAQAVGATVLLIGLYLTAKTLRTTQEGQITDRFTKAINQLGEPGPEKLAIRLGGIYALERIARDSLRDKPPIVEILAAYVRAHAAWKEEQLLHDESPPSETPPMLGNQLHPRPASIFRLF